MGKWLSLFPECVTRVLGLNLVINWFICGQRSSVCRSVGRSVDSIDSFESHSSSRRNLPTIPIPGCADIGTLIPVILDSRREKAIWLGLNSDLIIGALKRDWPIPVGCIAGNPDRLMALTLNGGTCDNMLECENFESQWANIFPFKYKSYNKSNTYTQSNAFCTFQVFFMILLCTDRKSVV